MDLKTVYADEQGNIVDAPKDFLPLINKNGVLVIPKVEDLIPLPKVADLICLPDHKPMAEYQGEVLPITGHSVCAILPPGYIATGLPAYERENGAEDLPAYPYAPVVAYRDQLYAMGEKINSSYVNPFQQYNTKNLPKLINNWQQKYPQNTLVNYMGDLAKEPGLYFAQDLFYQRGEVRLPLSKKSLPHPVLNLPYYPVKAQLETNPSGALLAQLAIAHLEQDNLITFGCHYLEDLEGAQTRLLNALGKIKERTNKGIINILTTGWPVETLAKLYGEVNCFTILVPTMDKAIYTSLFGEQAYQNLQRTLKEAQEHQQRIIWEIPYIPGFTNNTTMVEAMVAAMEQYKVAGVIITSPWLAQEVLQDLADYSNGKESSLLDFKAMVGELAKVCPVAGDLMALIKGDDHDC